LTRLAGALPLAFFAMLCIVPASAAEIGPPIQLLPQSLPATAPPSSPTPLPPSINPGYAPTPPSGLSPALTESVPVYQLSAPPSPSYPPPQLPGPIDQQKVQAYRNNLYSQQWQLQRQGVSPSSQYSREIQQQLNAPDPQ